MSGSILRQYVGHHRGEAAPKDDDEAAEDAGTFAFLRGARERAAMLELRKRNGEVLAVSYGFLDRVEYEPSQGILIHHGERTIRIKGRNLVTEARPNASLLSALLSHRATFIQETDYANAIQKSDDATVVEAIEW